MNYLYAAIVASAITVGATPSLAAPKFAPANTSFTLAGSMTLQQSQGSTGFDCPFSFAGLVTGGGMMKIKRAAFCAGVQASGLPWIWRPSTRRPPTFPFTMTASINGFNCGPFSALAFDNAGVFFFGNVPSANGCMIVGTVEPTSTPTITIVR